MFVGLNAKRPQKIKIFQRKDRCSTGLAEWSYLSDCVEALIQANNTEIIHSCNFEFIEKNYFFIFLN